MNHRRMVLATCQSCPEGPQLSEFWPRQRYVPGYCTEGQCYVAYDREKRFCEAFFPLETEWRAVRFAASLNQGKDKMDDSPF